MFSTIKEKISANLSDERTYKAMGYPAYRFFQVVVSEFVRCNNLREWLESGYKDAYDTAFRFYIKALKWFDFDWDKVENEFAECKELLSVGEIIDNILYVETQHVPCYTYSPLDSLTTVQMKHFALREKRGRKLVHLLAYKERLEGKTPNEILRECGLIAQEHYRAKEGRLEGCEDILAYRVEILGKVCRLDIEGRFVRFLRKSLCEEDRGDLFLRVREKVQSTSHNDTAEKMGYKEFWRFKKGAEILGSCENLEEWIGRGFYGLGMRASEFFVGLADVFFDEKEEAVMLVKKYRNISKRCEKFDGVIFVITQKRAKDFVEYVSDYGVGILNEVREIHIDRRMFRSKTSTEVIELLKKQIKSHYIRNDGELGIWGKIKGYKIKIKERIFEFDTQGELIQEVEMAEKRREKINGLTQFVKASNSSNI